MKSELSNSTQTDQKQASSAELTNPNTKAAAPNQYQVIRRNGKVTSFDANKITVAITKAFLAVEGSSAASSKRIHQTVEGLAAQVVDACTRRLETGSTVHIEDIQDQVELALMRDGQYKIARAYVLYREERARERIQATTKRKPLNRLFGSHGMTVALYRLIKSDSLKL